MKRPYYKILVTVLAIAIIAGFVPLLTSAASETVLNPLGHIAPVVNRPLATRLTQAELHDANIALAFYAKPQNPHAVRAIGEMLEADFGVAARMYNIGSSIGAKPLGYYDTLAAYDAVIFGVADCALSAWWTAYHAMMVEYRGTPVVVLTHELFERTLEIGALDNGFTGVRSAIICARVYASGFMHMSAAGSTDFLSNSPDFRLTFDQTVTALTAPLTSDEIDPPAITAQQLAGWTTGDPGARTLTVTGFGSTALLNFNEMAMELGFGDGLPLVMPLPELVAQMLEATVRTPDELLGKVMPRGGMITVEKVAVNAVMAGARPEYFPVILAAMEAYASSWEDGNLLYHALTSSENYSMLLLVSGPIVEELGISGQWGQHGAGNEASNAIGRAVRLSIRNIGQNRTHETDGSARVGRQNDHAITVLGAEQRLLPTGWESTHQLMGFDAHQSTVTLLGYHAQSLDQGAGGWMMAWTQGGILNALRTQLSAPARDAGNIMIATMPRAVAEMARRDGMPAVGGADATLPLESLAAVRNRIAHPGGTAAPLVSRYQVWPVITGDPDTARTFRAINTYYGTQAFQTRLITGATQTVAGRDIPTPNAPQNVQLTWNHDRTEATLSWDAPTRIGGASGGYQVTMTGGSAAGVANPGGMRPFTTATVDNPAAAMGSAIPVAPGVLSTAHPDAPAWHDVPSGQMTYTFTELNPDAQHFFAVRMANDVQNAFALTNERANMTPDFSASGYGAWAFATDVGRFTLEAFNNGTCEQVPDLAGRIRIWPHLDGVHAPVPMNAVITALDQEGNDAMQFVTRNRQWIEGEGWQDYYVNFDVDKDGSWQYITFTVTAFGQVVEVVLINNLYEAVVDIFGMQYFNNGNSSNVSLANLGVIRVWMQRNGINALVPYAELEVTATLPNGQDAMEFVRINRIWNDPEHVNLIDVRKDASWQYINFTATLFGQTVEILLINDLYVPVTDILGLQAFNNGNDNNVSLANAGIIRIWTQLNGVNALVSYDDLTVAATLPGGDCAMEFVRVNRVWNNMDYVNLIDVTKNNAPWQYIDLTVTLESQTVALRLINNTY
ncbi:MAG: fibronectin type III domain-containing protein [Oscillospiraceae bacterium]|nr:fibronectin type III domain-containing protein [Oscillospiraceae bacterium]